ncbi:MAG: cellulase family glycosylhydrolase [Eubacteriales bacterium]|nr:cellulase family glycosylhydrolase [Eubacteriales bacterium]
MKKVMSIVLSIVLIMSCITIPVMAEEQENKPFEFVNYSRQLTVRGNKLVYQDDSDTMVTLRGMNVPSMGWGMREHLNESIVECFDAWNANLIRLPITSKYWFGDKDATTGEYTGTYIKSGKTYTVADYRAAIDAMVQGTAARGKYIIIDNHGYVLPEEHHAEMFRELCVLYGNNPAVLFGVLNEPHGKTWDKWYYGEYTDETAAIPGTGDATDESPAKEYKYVGHQYMVEQIRDTGAKNILVVGGLSYAYNIGGILDIRDQATGATYELTDCGSNEDASKTGYGIMYDTHIYPVKGNYSNWKSTIGEMRKKHPILCGEWGWDSSDSVVTGSTSNIASYWTMQLLNFMDDTLGDYGGVPMNWTAWNMHMSSTPRMITGWNFNPTTFHGAYVKERLLSYPSTALKRDETIAVDFSESKFRAYTESNTTNIEQNGKLSIAYKANTNFYSRLVLPIEWDMNGLETINLTIKGPAGHEGYIGLYATDEELYSIPVIYTGEDQNISINVDQLEFDRSYSKMDGSMQYSIHSLQIGSNSTPTDGIIEVTKTSFVKSANPTIQLPVIVDLPTRDLFFDMEAGENTFASHKPWKGASSADTISYAYEKLPGYDGNDTNALKISYVYSGEWSGNVQLNFHEGSVPAGSKYVSMMVKGTGLTRQKIQVVMDGYSVYPEILEGDDDWRQFIFDIRDGVPDSSTVKFLKIYLKNKVADSFYLDNVSFTAEKPERVIESSDEEEEAVIKTLPYTFERSVSYKHDIALKVKEGDEGDTISHRVIEDGFASTKANYITYTRGSGAPATAIISYNNDSDFFKAPSRTTWYEDMKSCEDLVFDAKSMSGKNEKVKLAIYDACTILSDYLEFEFTPEWKRYRIPVSAFTDPLSGFPMRCAVVRSYYFQSAEENTSGSFLIDNIILTNDPELPGAEESLVEYVNTFDGEDLFTANGGGWTPTSTAEAPDESGNYYYNEYEPHAGINGSGAMHIYNNWAGTSNTIKITGFPADWDFSKAFYIGAMIKSSNMVNGAKKIPTVGNISVKLYNGDTLTGTATLAYSPGGWNWSEGTFSLNSKITTDMDSVLKGTDSMVISNSGSMKNDFYIDDLTFSYVSLKSKKLVDYPMDYHESGSITGMGIGTPWEQLSAKNGFIKNVDNAGLVGDHGATIQFVYSDEMKATGNTYVYWTPRAFWDIRRSEYFSFAASLMTDPSRKTRWKTKNINTAYPYIDDYCNETLDVSFSMVDIYGNEYKSPAVTLDSYATKYYKVPVDGFVDSDGNAPNFNQIAQMRMYPQTDVVGGCYWFDEYGFKNDAQYLDNITSNFINQGVNAQTGSVTAQFVNNAGTDEKYTILAAIYRKSDMSLYDIKNFTGNITANSLSLTLENITLPEDKENYMIKFFIWNGDGSSMSELNAPMYLPAIVNY